MNQAQSSIFVQSTSVLCMFLFAGCEKKQESPAIIGTDTIPNVAVRCAYVPRAEKELCFDVLNGRALFEADIELTGVDIALSKGGKPAIRSAVVRVSGTSREFLWPGAIVPYEIESGVERSRVLTAIDHFHLHTGIRFISPRDNTTDKVIFRRGEGCYSPIGRVGGTQFITIGIECTPGLIIHELMHTLGFWHEQGRSDRDKHLTIHWENIAPGKEHNFQHLIDGSNTLLPYDYQSILHYSATAFSKNGLPTLSRLDGSIKGLGQHEKLSNGDIQAIQSAYSGNTDLNIFDSWQLLTVDQTNALMLSENNTRAESKRHLWGTIAATRGRNTGKHYWEFSFPIEQNNIPLHVMLGVDTVDNFPNDNYAIRYTSYTIGTLSCLNLRRCFSDVSLGAYGKGDTVGIAVNLDSDVGIVWIRKNGVWLNGNPALNEGGGHFEWSIGQKLYPMVTFDSGISSVIANFGQQPFRNPFPTGFFPGWMK